MPWGRIRPGIKVPLARLLELLPAGPHENEEAAPRQAKPAEPEKLDPRPGWPGRVRNIRNSGMSDRAPTSAACTA